MRYKTIDKVKAGEKVGMDLFDLRGRIVLAKGITITDRAIQKLVDQGFPGIYVDDEISKDIYIAPAISPVLVQKAKESVKANDIDLAIQCSKDIVNDILKNGHIAPDLLSMKDFDDAAYVHTVNVAVICCLMGISHSMTVEDLDALVLAALLRDVGKSQIPLEILNKPGKLDKYEYELIKKHSTYSYDMIADRNDISYTVKNAVLMHHENYDGSGYPMGVSKNQISYLARIIHVADIYDALISDKPYRPGNTIFEAAEYLMGGSGVYFDKEVVDLFFRAVPLYQKGTELVLSTGEHGVIIDNYGDNNLRPKVRVLSTHEVIDLSDVKYAGVTYSTLEEFEKSSITGVNVKKESLIIPVAKKKILVVDDMKMNRILLRGILEEKYALTYAASGEAAIEMVTLDPEFDLVIMDIEMPGVNGLEAAEHINQITDYKLPILFVTTVNNVETVIKCKQLKAAGYITRPYKRGYVQTEIERIIENTF